MIALINEGLVPCPFVEGDYTSRLDIIKDVPEGKVCYAFEATDMARAKQALGGRVCIRGAIPISVLTTGTPEDVRAACKKLIDTAGKDGGFIMDASTTLEDARLENVRAMFQATREYGVY
jgi:uroporphyrinogen-III decarboxylase